MNQNAPFLTNYLNEETSILEPLIEIGTLMGKVTGFEQNEIYLLNA